MRLTTADEIVEGLEAIIDAAAGVLAEKSLEATLAGMVTALDAIVGFTSLALYEADHPRRVMIPVFAVGRYVQETLADRPPFDHSIAGRVVTTGEMAHLAPEDPRQRPYKIPGTPDEEIAAMVVAPLCVGEAVIGTLNVWREGDDAADFAPGEAQLIRRFATLAALAYANAKQRERLSRQALTDELTGLANRRHFHDRMAAELKRAHREGSGLSLLLFDLDDFKAINDRHGHLVGDEALCGFAEVLRREARASDVVCRTGGEEFAVILPSTGREDAVVYAERLLSATRAARLGPLGTMTASVGLAGAPDDSSQALFRIADDRLLLAKAHGKNRVETGS